MRKWQSQLVGSLAAVLAAATLLLAPGSAPAPPPKGLDVEGWRGTDTVLLEAPGHRITEREFLALTMLIPTYEPKSVLDWPTAPGSVKAQLRDQLEAHLQLLLLAADWAPTAPGDLDLDSRAERIYAAPIGQVLWGESMLNETTQVYPEDVYYEYTRNPEEYSIPGTRTLLRLRVPLPESPTAESLTQARRRANAPRHEALGAGSLEAVLEANPEFRIDPVGEPLIVRPGEGSADPLLRERAAQLAISQISDPIQTRDGVYLLELIAAEPGELLPLSAVTGEIAATLRQRHLRLQFDYQLTRDTLRARPYNNSHFYPNLNDRSDIIRVRKYAILRSEFRRLFPEIIGLESDPNELAIQTKAAEIILGEVAIQQMERRGLLPGDPFWTLGLDMGRLLFRAGDVVRSRMATAEPTDEEVAQYLADNMDELAPTQSKVVWSLALEPRGARNMSPAEVAGLRLVMRRYMRDLLADARNQFDERLRLSKADAVEEPGDVLRLLAEPQDSRVRLRYRRVGAYNAVTAPQFLEAEYDELELGSFTQPVDLRDGSVAAYYVSEEVETDPPAEDVLLEMARVGLRTKIARAGTLARVDEWKANNQLRYHPDLLTGDEE